jgi:hypothetical protein
VHGGGKWARTAGLRQGMDDTGGSGADRRRAAQWVEVGGMVHGDECGARSLRDYWSRDLGIFSRCKREVSATGKLFYPSHATPREARETTCAASLLGLGSTLRTDRVFGYFAPLN